MIKSDVIQRILDKCRTASDDGQRSPRLSRRSAAAGGGITGPAVRRAARRPPRDPQTGIRLGHAGAAPRKRRR